MATVSINAKDVAALREKTGLGMMDCKQALTETKGDLSAAVELLRAKLKGKMDLRADRPASEGIIAVAIAPDRGSAAMVELSTETDFTARNETTRAAAEKIAAAALAATSAGEVSATKGITDVVDNLRITTGENISYRRGVKISGGHCGFYVHHDRKKGVLIQLTGPADAEVVSGLCQHITAYVPVPVGVNESDVPKEIVDRVRRDAESEAAESGKPADIIKKMVEGKVRKYLQEVTLLNQKYVKDPEGKKAVKDVLPTGVTVTKFVRWTQGLG